ERDRCCQTLPGCRACIGQRPDIAQTIILGVVDAEGVAQNRHQRYPLVVFSRLDAGESCVNSYQFSTTRHFDALQSQYLRKRDSRVGFFGFWGVWPLGPDGVE